MVGIRKARFASFVLLLTCFAAMMVVFVLIADREIVYIAWAVIVAVHLTLWWFIYRRILLSEAKFFEAVTEDMYAIHFRLRTFETALRQIKDGVVIVSENDDLVFVNDTVKGWFAAFDDDLDVSRYDEHATGFSEKLERGSILEAAKENRPPEKIDVDGQFYRIVYVSLVPEKGKWRGAVAVISDVTESTKADRMQSDFIANVSHELRTPLTSVKTYAETLMTGSVEEEAKVREFLEIIVTQTDHIDGLIQDYKDMASMDYMKLVLDMTESDLPSLVRMVYRKLELEANKKSLTVNCMFDPEMGLIIEMDRVKIDQVLMNVIGNAIKYTDEKGRVDIDIIPKQNCVEIEVKDNGMGISEEDLSRVFERFFRSENARTGKSTGSGLGLGISKQIVEGHGGSIEIKSKYGGGTTVTISLPTGKRRGVPGIL